MIVEAFLVIGAQGSDLLEDQSHAGIHDAGAFVDAP